MANNLSKPGAISFFLSWSSTSKNVTYRIVPAAMPCNDAFPIVWNLFSANNDPQNIPKIQNTFILNKLQFVSNIIFIYHTRIF